MTLNFISMVGFAKPFMKRNINKVESNMRKSKMTNDK